MLILNCEQAGCSFRIAPSETPQIINGKIACRRHSITQAKVSVNNQTVGAGTFNSHIAYFRYGASYWVEMSCTFFKDLFADPTPCPVTWEGFEAFLRDNKISEVLFYPNKNDPMGTEEFMTKLEAVTTKCKARWSPSKIFYNRDLKS